MDKYSQQLDSFLQLLEQGSFLITDRDKANIQVVLAMLGPVDEEIFESYYGIFNVPRQSLETIADRYHLRPVALQQAIEKDLRRLAITPEWQMMLRQFSPLLRHRLGL